MEACSAYVAQLQAKRSEEEASRAARAQRRANTVAANHEMYKRRAYAIRRRVMEEKLLMTSQREMELFAELSALSKWRHVMYENIAHREKQHAEAQQQQGQLHSDYLQTVREAEEGQFAAIVRDDKERFDAAQRETIESKQRHVSQLCRQVVSDVLDGVDQHIDFIACHGLTGPNAVPPAISRAMVLKAAFPTNVEALQASVVQRHVAMTAYTTADESGAVALPPTEMLHSKLFVSLVQKLLHLQFPKPPPFKPKNPGPHAIVILTGPKGSGKTSIANAVGQNLGMVVLSDVQLIESALQEFGRDLTENDWSGSNVSAELLDLGRECQDALLQGQPVSVDLLARLILYHLKRLPESCTGVILDGTPGTVEGFERLEQTLSGYDKTRVSTIPEELLAPLFDGVDIDDAVFLVEKPDPNAAADGLMQAGGVKGKDPKAAKPKGKKDEHEEPLPPIELPVVEPIPPLSEEEEEALLAVERDVDTSSIHAVVHIDCDPEELFKRFAGLRIDRETGEVYHITARPPPADRLPFLVSRDRSEVSTAKVHDIVEQHMEEWRQCVEWLSRYDGLVHEMDASKSLNDLIANVTDISNVAADNAVAYYQRFTLAEEVRQRQVAMQQWYEERVASREAARKQLATIYLERGAELPPELQEPPKSSEPQYCTLPSNFPPLFLDYLHQFVKYYTTAVNTCHTELQKLLLTVFTYGNTCEAYVKTYWLQQDPKQALLDGFIHEFNQMQPALRRDVQGKEELHLRADQLTDQLFGIVERRKEECSQLIESLHHRSTYTDNWCDAVRAVGMTLIQSEVERFFTSRNLSLLYFSALKNDPVSIEDELLELVPQLRMVAQEQTAPDPKAAKDKKAPPPKKGGKGTEEPTEKAAEDTFTPAVEKAIAVLKGALDRLSAAQAPVGGKGAKVDKKGPGAAEIAAGSGDAMSPHVLSAPIAAEEFEATKQRIMIIVAYVKELVQVGLKRTESVRSKLLQHLRKLQMVQSSAVNSAIFEIRSAIEEERPVLFHLHLGTETFQVDTSKPLAATADSVCLSGVPFAGLAVPPEPQVLVTTTLTKKRVMELIHDFRILAPGYDVHKPDFLWLVRPSDYADASPKTAPLPVDVIFDRFDVSGCGVIDWRDFLTHLLFWCEPVASDAALFEEQNSLGNEGPSLTQLFDMHADIGSDPLTHDDFMDTPLFFDGEMPESRLMAYLELLWEIFRVDHQLFPDTLLTFMCPDPQPLRGIQKAFVVASAPGDELCAARPDALYTVFHANTACPRNMLMRDPHSLEIIKSLAPEGAETLVFGDACKSHYGRVIFNSTTLFHRKTFV